MTLIGVLECSGNEAARMRQYIIPTSGGVIVCVASVTREGVVLSYR